ncbi:hypothetical protein VTN31DRAFT_2959 [Thermomyces dupontii]|uniref:uncharacterized protein n=1 Tax=Talaromyces thermophilus TaxID=28565 RepID=UPI003743F629
MLFLGVAPWTGVFAGPLCDGVDGPGSFDATDSGGLRELSGEDSAGSVWLVDTLLLTCLGDARIGSSRPIESDLGRFRGFLIGENSPSGLRGTLDTWRWKGNVLVEGSLTSPPQRPRRHLDFPAMESRHDAPLSVSDSLIQLYPVHHSRLRSTRGCVLRLENAA